VLDWGVQATLALPGKPLNVQIADVGYRLVLADLRRPVTVGVDAGSRRLVTVGVDADSRRPVIVGVDAGLRRPVIVGVDAGSVTAGSRV